MVIGTTFEIHSIEVDEERLEQGNKYKYLETLVNSKWMLEINGRTASAGRYVKIELSTGKKGTPGSESRNSN